MRNYLILLILFFLLKNVHFSQTLMKIHKNDGVTLQIPINQIDSITYSLDTILPISNDVTFVEGRISEISENMFIIVDYRFYKNNTQVSEYGICWSTNPNPTINDNKFVKGTSASVDPTFVEDFITGLASFTKYYFKVYVIHNMGVSYSNERSFVTKSLTALNPTKTYGSVTDVEGNQYPTIIIGNQEWMASNLKTTKYSNGDTLVSSLFSTWYFTAPPYPGMVASSVIYTDEKFYNWYAINDSRNVCPSGWHVPTSNDLDALILNCGGVDSVGIKLKSNWLNAEWMVGTATFDPAFYYPSNETGFSALPRGRNNEMTTEDITYSAHFWYNNEVDINNAKSLVIVGDQNGIINGIESKKNGFSVRCVRD